jgi:hypothetical protein
MLRLDTKIYNNHEIILNKFDVIKFMFNS